MRLPAGQMRERVKLATLTITPDGPVAGEPREVRAAVRFREKAIVTDEGKIITATAQVKLDPENAPAVESFITVGVGTPYAREAKVVRATLVSPPRQAAYVEAWVE